MKVLSNVERYGLALFSCAVALAIARPLDAPASCFSLAVMVSSLYGRSGAGLFAVILSTLGFYYFFLPPGFELSITSDLRFSAFVVVSFSITRLIGAKQHAEDARRKVDEQQRILAETAPDAIISLDTTQQIRFVNPAATKVFGWTRSELIGKPLATLLPGFALEERAPAGIELVGRRKDGAEFAAEAFFGEAETGEQRFFTGVIRDISERKRTENALRESERNLALIVEAIPGMVWSAVPAGDLDYVNRRVLDYSGNSAGDPAQFRWTNIVHPDDVALTFRSWSNALVTGQQHNVEYRLRRSDGQYRWFQVIAEPLRDSEGRIVRWYGLILDIDDRKNAEEALGRTQERLSRATQIATVGELAASIAHEINQPLAAVVTNAHACLQWLSAEPPNLENARLAVQRIVRDGNGAAEVVKRIRALFKRAALEKADLDVNEVIAEVLRLLRGESLRRGVTVETELEQNLPHAVGDRVQLQQVILNLLLNGMEAMDTVLDGAATLAIRSMRRGSDAILVEIRDHGIGLRDTEKVFEAFFTTKRNGMGMGLPICRTIVEAHGGSLWATSGDGPGATFSFTLPLRQGAPL